MVAIGTDLADALLQRSVLPLLTHTAPTSIDDSKALLRPQMEDSGRRHLTVADNFDSVTVEARFMAKSAEEFTPLASVASPKGFQRSPVTRDIMVGKASPQNSRKPYTPCAAKD